MAASFTVAEIERFLIDEAALLDEWRLEEWLALFAEDGRYLVPSLAISPIPITEPRYS